MSIANENYKVARYALGRDYHKVLKKKLKKIYKQICDKYGEIPGRYFVDSAPVLERDWAKKSGIGWIGKNTLMITKKTGSYYFLSEIVLSGVEVAYDGTTTDHCGSCTKCIDACPTDALLKPYTLDSSKCISYLTIEYKKEKIPEDTSLSNWVFGCDICQEVCPWNSFSVVNNEKDFSPNKTFLSWEKKIGTLWTTVFLMKYFINLP